MLTCYRISPDGLQPQSGPGEPPELPHGAGPVWIDAANPEAGDIAWLEATTGLSIPTRDDIQEIEASSRLYREDGAVFLSVSLATGILRRKEMMHASLQPLAMILSPNQLITIRYDDLLSIDRFAAQAQRPDAETAPDALLLMLFEVIIDRLADAIERIGAEIDLINTQAFRRASHASPSGRAGRPQRFSNLVLQSLLERLGYAQDALSKARESAVTLGRAVSYLILALPKDARRTAELKSLARDLASLTDHASFLGGSVTFLLDATLGLISIEQNAVLKIFSVFAVLFMPPTLIAGIYGMNFLVMPELQWPLGYPMAVGLMLCSSILAYGLARWRGWL